MPLQFTSAIAEHNAVRSHCGIFDVSHMTVVDIGGPAARPYLERLLANDIGKLKAVGQGLYSCMLNRQGGVVDDLIAYRTAADAYRLVVNAATRDKDLSWMHGVAGRDNVVIRHLDDVVMIALQGPQARALAAPLLPAGSGQAAQTLRPFECLAAGELFVARTGYTGEDGFEFILPASDGLRMWRALADAGATRCGLGARDTLRLEAGLNLYGQDMDGETTPLSSGLGWTVAFEPRSRQFIGREPLERALQSGVPERLAGLLLVDPGIMRHGQQVRTEAGDGCITSGGFSPTMKRSIALARLPVAAGGACQVSIRDQWRAGRIVKPPFVRRGRVLVDGV
jgi:aminomethyltransferase